jgi:hypothetical protein
MPGVVLDVTERKRAERTLWEIERPLEAIFESIQDGVCVLSPDLTNRRGNGVMRQWYARHLPLEGRKCHLCYHDRHKPCDPCPALRCIQTGRAESDIMPDADGRKLADRLMERQPGLKFLFVPGYTSNIIARHGVLDEGVESLEKPFSRQGLLHRARSAG